MADGWPIGVPAPTAPSYAAPLLDFSPIGNLPESYAAGDKSRAEVATRNAFRNGIPKTETGLPNYAAMAETLAKAGAPLGDVTSLVQSGVTMDILQRGVQKSGEFSRGGPDAAPTAGAAAAPPSLAPAPQSGQGSVTITPRGQGTSSPSAAAPATGGTTLMDLIAAHDIPDDKAGYVAATISRRMNIDPNAPITDPNLSANLQRQILAAGGRAPLPRQPQQQTTAPSAATNYGGDPTLGGLVPSGNPTRDLQYWNGEASNPLNPKQVQEAAAARAKAISEAMTKFGEPTPAQREYLLNRRQNEPISAYEARKAGATELVKKDVDSFQKKYDAAQKLGHQAGIGLQQAQLGARMIDENNFYSGPFEPTVRAYRQFASVIGADPNKAMPQEALNKVINGMLTEQITALGGSGVGQVRVAEVKIMQQAIASLGISAATNRLLLELMQRTYKDNMEIAKIVRNVSNTAEPGQRDVAADNAIADYYERHPLLNEAERNDFRLIAPPTFKTFEQARAAGLPDGQPVKVGGRIVYINNSAQAPQQPQPVR